MAAMAEVPAVMPHLHLAVQSGSTRILRAMRRSYTREGYLDLARRLKRAVSGIALSTDIMCGAGRWHQRHVGSRHHNVPCGENVVPVDR